MLDSDESVARCKMADERLLAEIARRLNTIFGDKEHQHHAPKIAPYSIDGWISIKTVCRQLMSDLFYGKDDSTICNLVDRALEKQPSTFVEQDTWQRGRIRRAPFNLRIVRLVEFWFSDANFAKDLYLQSLVDEATQLIPLCKLIEFKSLKQLLDAELGHVTAAEQRIKTVENALLLSPREVDVVYPIATSFTVGIRRKRLAKRVLETVERVIGGSSSDRCAVFHKATT